MKIGIDLVYISKFKEKLDKIGGRENVFKKIELEQADDFASLAGKFAAKEAFVKALGHFCGWQNVWIEKEKNGAPVIKSGLLNKDESALVSITRKEDVALAMVVITKKG